MATSLLGYLELFIVLAFVAGWGILELYTRRFDRERQKRENETRGGERRERR
ncbi:MAG: hypothetical protein ACOZDY_15340 [Pseudomonadota bacterium]